MSTKQTYKQRISKLLPLLLSTTLLTGCQSLPTTHSNQKPITNLTNAYSYQLLKANKQAINLKQLATELNQADVIFIGEYHGNHASHLLQTQLFELMHQQHPKLVLSMEMFNRDQQATLNEYLDGIIGEQTLIDQAPAWNNYKASYRPTVEYAKQHLLPVIAANASGDLIRCIGAQGKSYLAKLDKQEQQWLAQQPFAEIKGYEDKFFGFMNQAGHQSNDESDEHRGHNNKKISQQSRNTYLAQITRDNTMAESILKAIQHNPGSKLIHLNGSFHSENHLGTVGALKRLAPQLNIKVITPIYQKDFEAEENNLATKGQQDDFYYLINPQPAEYVHNQNRMKAFQAMFKKARQKAKSCK